MNQLLPHILSPVRAEKRRMTSNLVIEDACLIRDSGYHHQGKYARAGKPLAGTLACVILLFAAGPMGWGQINAAQNETILAMIRVVLENNATLASQEALVRESQKLPELRSTFVLTGISFSAATSVWDPGTNTFRFFPALTIGTSLSLSDPARLLNSYNLKKEREGAKQEYQKIRNSLIADLMSAVVEIMKLYSRRDSLAKLKVYLEDYSELIEKQVRAGVGAPELDKLWNLKERIITLEADLKDVEDQLGTKRLETATSLGGEAWRELLDLMARLDARA
jgi:outer membrane protein TolC